MKGGRERKKEGGQKKDGEERGEGKREEGENEWVTGMASHMCQE